MTSITKNRVKNVFYVLNIKKIFLPICISIIAMAILMYRDKPLTINNLVLIKNMSLKSLCCSIVVLCLRDFLYILRIRLLVDRKLRWSSCFIIIMLWEFSSAVTPSSVGGGVVAVFLFIHEGISLGEAIAYVLLSATFDNYFFILSVPLSYLGLPSHSTILTNQFINSMFWLSYCIIFIYASFMSFSLFIKPEFFKALMIQITKIKFLKRFHSNAIKQGDNLITSSRILRQHSFSFWIVILIITLMTWLCRYIILNCIISGFVNFSLAEHIEIICKHLIMWITMLISPTPGGSGIIEYCFDNLYKNTLGDYTMIISIIWRFLTYYVYLIAGLIILPSWIRSFKKYKTIKNQ